MHLKHHGAHVADEMITMLLVEPVGQVILGQSICDQLTHVYDRFIPVIRAIAFKLFCAGSLV